MILLVVYQMTFKGEKAMNGDSSMLISPEVELPASRILSFNMILENAQVSTTTKLDILITTKIVSTEESIASYDVPQSKIFVCIPAGIYSVIFRGIVAHSNESVISVSNISIGAECEFLRSRFINTQNSSHCVYISSGGTNGFRRHRLS